VSGNELLGAIQPGSVRPEGKGLQVGKDQPAPVDDGAEPGRIEPTANEERAAQGVVSEQLGVVTQVEVLADNTRQGSATRQVGLHIGQ